MKKLKMIKLCNPSGVGETSYRTMPVWITAAVLACLFFAAMGEWKVLNIALKGLPKIVSLGVLGIAFLNLFVTADFKEFKKAAEYLPILMTLIVMIATLSLLIWALSFTARYEITRGFSKLVFQGITVLIAVSLVYMYGSDGVEVLFWSIVAANTTIMIIEAAKAGISDSIQSLIYCFATFGEAEGFIRQMELHDITFLFGQFIIYYLCFAKNNTEKEKKMRYLKLAISIFFLLLGLKRATFAAVMLVVCTVVFIRTRKNRMFWILLEGMGLFAIAWAYIYVVWNGSFLKLMAYLDVNMMGREFFWEWARDYYQFSPGFLGLGFEAETAIITSWYNAGMINHLYPFHNNFLKVFVEMGFWGFALWVGIQTILFPLYWGKKYSDETALLYMSLFAYMYVTYLTDNTAFYFWVSIGLRLMPTAFSYRVVKENPLEATHWHPRDRQEIMAMVMMDQLRMDDDTHE